ncbi:MAG: adenosine deaminase family protein [Chloroflexota bacterium]
MQFDDFIHALPKAELHLHFEGAVPWDMVQKHAPKATPNVPPWWKHDFKFDDFRDFGQVMRACFAYVLTDLNRYHDMARVIFAGLAAQNVRYVETSFSLEFASSITTQLSDIVTAIKTAAPKDMVVKVFCGINRGENHPLTDPMIESIFQADNLDGIDLHGDERLRKPQPFADIFAKAQAQGLMTKAHAGELIGPQSIWDALDHLHVKRIEHGATAIFDEDLMERLALQEVTLDLCPTSNLKLQVVDKITDHPIRYFHEHGIKVTVNSDDPTIFGCTLSQELTLLVKKLGFSPADLAQLQMNAFEVADMADSQRQAIRDELKTLTAAL